MTIQELQDKLQGKPVEGYLWLSDAEKPHVYHGKPINFHVEENSNPFIVEGMLNAENTSYLIRYVDGKYYITETAVKADKDAEDKTFITSFNPALTLKIRQYWREKKDEFCQNMPVLQPAEWAFLGIEETNNTKEETK